MQTESFPGTPLQQIIPSYSYWQYSSDSDLQGFIFSFNSLVQGYLQWFINTPLSVYTNSNISGPLLDWVGNGIYGISRPVIITRATSKFGPYNTTPYNALAYNSRKIVAQGTAQLANDDLYKRAMTWILYLGDGKQLNLTWLKKRIARFLYGVNGSDISIDQIQNVNIAVSSWKNMAAPTVTPASGGSGAIHYSYEVTAVPAYGGETLGATATTTTGNTSLSAKANNLTWTAPTGGAGAITYNVYRTASAGSPSTVGLIATGIETASFSDTGFAGDGSIPPSANSTLLYGVTIPNPNGIGHIFTDFIAAGILPLPLQIIFTFEVS